MKRSGKFGLESSWLINDLPFDPLVPLTTVTRDQPEVWTNTNGGGDWLHPMHMHMEEHTTLERVGSTLAAHPEDTGMQAKIAAAKAKAAGKPLPITRTDVDGAFKASTIRNVELTGPYLHNGGESTLKQVVEFYTRGGNFADVNIDNHNPEVAPIGALRGKPAEQDNIVAFMLTLTDPRVKNEGAPFDHPELLIPSGDGLQDQATGAIAETFVTLPAVGAGGRAPEGLPPLGTFMGLSPFAQQ